MPVEDGESVEISYGFQVFDDSGDRDRAIVRRQVHVREAQREFEDRAGFFAARVVKVNRQCRPDPKAGGVIEAEGGVVGRARRRMHGQEEQRIVRTEAQVMVADSEAFSPGQVGEPAVLLVGRKDALVGEIRGVEADFPAAVTESPVEPPVAPASGVVVHVTGVTFGTVDHGEVESGAQSVLGLQFADRREVPLASAGHGAEQGVTQTAGANLFAQLPVGVAARASTPEDKLPNCLPAARTAFGGVHVVGKGHSVTLAMGPSGNRGDRHAACHQDLSEQAGVGVNGRAEQPSADGERAVIGEDSTVTIALLGMALALKRKPIGGCAGDVEGQTTPCPESDRRRLAAGSRNDDPFNFREVDEGTRERIAVTGQCGARDPEGGLCTEGWVVAAVDGRPTTGLEVGGDAGDAEELLESIAAQGFIRTVLEVDGDRSGAERRYGYAQCWIRGRGTGWWVVKGLDSDSAGAQSDGDRRGR